MDKEKTKKKRKTEETCANNGIFDTLMTTIMNILVYNCLPFPFSFRIEWNFVRKLKGHLLLAYICLLCAPDNSCIFLFFGFIIFV